VIALEAVNRLFPLWQRTTKGIQHIRRKNSVRQTFGLTLRSLHAIFSAQDRQKRLLALTARQPHLRSASVRQTSGGLVSDD